MVNLFSVANKMFPNDEDLEAERQLTRREAKQVMKNWRIMRGGKAGIPSSYMFKQISQMTLAEAIDFQRRIQSGQSWGDIQKMGLAGDEGELTEHEYRFFFDPDYEGGMWHNPDARLDTDGRVNMGHNRWTEPDE